MATEPAFYHRYRVSPYALAIRKEEAAWMRQLQAGTAEALEHRAGGLEQQLADAHRTVETINGKLAHVRREQERKRKRLLSPGPMICCVDHGIAKRLAILLSYHTVAQTQGRELVVVWKQSFECHGDFLDCFDPLPGVHFLRAVPAWAAPAAEAEGLHPDFEDTPEAVTACYARLRPIASVMDAISRRLVCLGGADTYVAVHLRRMDLARFCGDTSQTVEGQTPDVAYETFLDGHAPTPVFIATDCGETHKRFQMQYEPRLGVNMPRATFDASHYRQTCNEAAVVDMFVCAASKAFLGSSNTCKTSAFSEAVHSLRRVRGV